MCNPGALSRPGGLRPRSPLLAAVALGAWFMVTGSGTVHHLAGGWIASKLFVSLAW